MEKVKFKVGLSSGETFYEGKGTFVRVPGELSPWQKLLRYVAQKRTKITSLSLYTDDGHTYNLPSAGNNPKFHAFMSTPAPFGYDFGRRVGADRGEYRGGKIIKYDKPQNEETFAVATALYRDYQLQYWVSEDNPKNCWVIAVPYSN